MKTVIILSNLGTPNDPSPKSVGKFLKEFLSDPDVIPLPKIIKYPLVNFLIVPKRAPQSAEKYQKIWTEAGSPLLVNSRALLEKMKSEMDIPVVLGMRYGTPSLEHALEEALSHSPERIVLFPLYPQYAAATSGSTENRFRHLCKVKKFKGTVHVHESFPEADYYIQPQAALIQEARTNEHVLFTFHGLPVSEIKKVSSKCLTENCCAKITAENSKCYRAQCFATAKKLAQALKLEKNEWSISFQSRLGPTKWIGPYTEDILAELPKKGVKSVLLAAPSFVADCLETLEELGIQGKEIFLRAGGEKFQLISCVNADANFVSGLAKKIEATLQL